MQLMKRPVVLVSFDDEELALARLRVRSEVAEHAADDDGRVEAGFGEDSGDHRRRRGLAVRAGDAYSALAVHELAEHFGTADDPHSQLARLVDLGVYSFDCRGDDDGVDVVHVRRIVADRNTDSPAHQELGGRGGAEVATRYRQSRVLKDFSDATHPDSADPDEMDGFNVTKMHSVRGVVNYQF